jgi:hypothetical protein
VLTSVKAAGKPTPVVTGQDSEVESVKSIMAGEQYSTINKDTRKLVEHAIVMVKDLQAGKTPEINDDKSYNNGSRPFPAYLLEPVIVTKKTSRRLTWTIRYSARSPSLPTSVVKSQPVQSGAGAPLSSASVRASARFCSKEASATAFRSASAPLNQDPVSLKRLPL